MTGRDAKDIRDRVEQESFDYAFAHYSEFLEIKDAKFHKLRKAFLEARKQLIDYCGLEEC